AVDEQNIGKGLQVIAEPLETARHHFVNAGEIVNALDVANAKSSIARLERQPVDELHEAGHRLVAAKVGNIDPLDCARLLGQLQDFLQAGQSLFGVDVKHLGLGV